MGEQAYLAVLLASGKYLVLLLLVQSVANIRIYEYICEYSLRIIFIFVFAVNKNYKYYSYSGAWLVFWF